MLELIAIVAALAVCVLTPIEVRRIRRGWVPRKFAGDRAKHLAAYRKQLTVLIFAGAIFGVLGLVMASLATRPGEATVKIVAAAIWLAVSCVCFVSRRMLPSEPATELTSDAGR
jgi:hypothetical protein